MKKSRVNKKVFCKDCRWGKVNCINHVECRNPKFLDVKKDRDSSLWGTKISKDEVEEYTLAEFHNSKNACIGFEQKKISWWNETIEEREKPILMIIGCLFVGLILMFLVAFHYQSQLAECQSVKASCEPEIQKWFNRAGGYESLLNKLNSSLLVEEQQRVEEVQIKRFACYEICRTDYTSGTVKEYDCCLWQCDRKYSNFDFSEENNPCLEQPVRECVEWAETHTIGTLFVCTEEIASSGTCCIVDDSIQTGINKICETEEVGGKLVNCSGFCLKWNHCFCWSDEPCASEGK